MPPLKDLSNQQFGMLTVLEPDGRGKSGGVRWLCLCACGKQKIVQSTHLVSGNTTSCGSHSRPERVKDLTSLRFGKLEALKVTGRDRWSRATWLCQCDCGVTKVIPSHCLISGAVISCGCYARSISGDNGRAGASKISGSKSYLYKSELSEEERVRGRNFPEVREWRRAVFARDDYTCDLCKVRGESIVAHHLNCWADYPKERLVIENGVTLCKQHHKDFHDSLGGARKSCARIDYEKFKARFYLDREIRRRSRILATASSETQG